MTSVLDLLRETAETGKESGGAPIGSWIAGIAVIGLAVYVTCWRSIHEAIEDKGGVLRGVGTWVGAVGAFFVAFGIFHVVVGLLAFGAVAGVT